MKCSLCNGPLILLGKLGSWKQYRCRNCGMIFSVRPRRYTKDMKPAVQNIKRDRDDDET